MLGVCRVIRIITHTIWSKRTTHIFSTHTVPLEMAKDFFKDKGPVYNGYGPNIKLCIKFVLMLTQIQYRLNSVDLNPARGQS